MFVILSPKLCHFRWRFTQANNIAYLFLHERWITVISGFPIVMDNEIWGKVSAGSRKNTYSLGLGYPGIILPALCSDAEVLVLDFVIIS